MIDLNFSNAKLKRLFEDEAEMKKQLKNRDLVEGLKVLINHFESEESIYDFLDKSYLKGYNFEPIVNSKVKNLYSIRIVPKKDKFKERIIILKISSDGRKIEIYDLDKNHRYDR